jgi:hypothetical protein
LGVLVKTIEVIRVVEAIGKLGDEAPSRLPNAELLSLVVRELKEIDRRSGIERTLAIGELIINRFFDGNSAAWRDRRRNKNNSVRRLAERKDCPFCKSALHEAVAVYVASLGLPCVRTFGHIGASHVAAVLRLPEAQREQVLRGADQSRLSVRELRKHVVSLRRAEGERRGRPARNGVSSGLAQVEAGLAEVRIGIERVRGSLPLQACESDRLAELQPLSMIHDM